MRLIRSVLFVGAPILLASSLAFADISLLPGTVNMFRDNRGANDVGVGPGDVLQYGAEIAGGSAGAMLKGIAATGFVDPAQNCNPLTVNANFCAQGTAYNAGRLDPWTLVFTRGADSVSVQGPSVTGAAGAPIAFPTSVTLSGTGVTPTISWQLPAGLVPNGFRVQIFDKGRIIPGTTQADIIYSTSLAPNATSFTLPASAGLSSTGNYAINFQVIETRDGAAFTGSNTQILSRSNSYFDFAPLSGSVPHDVALPTIDASGVYNFHVGGVGPDHITFIDPLVAIGYHYLIGAGDPHFQSLLLPNVGDGIYTLTFADGTGNHTVSLLHDQQYFFGAGGVGDFTITGIETSAGLDPSNPTAFITGLTFSGNGDFTGTMTPLTELVAGVPEPQTYALMLGGFALLASIARRRQRR
jgi:hypothetical protein